MRNTNDGMVTSLNSQFVNNNQIACPAGTQLVAGACAETALRQNGVQVSYTAAFNECVGAGRRLPSNGKSALIAQALTATGFGTGNWT